MTQRHRRAHVVIWFVLGPLMLLALALAVSIRPAATQTAGAASTPGGTR